MRVTLVVSSNKHTGAAAVAELLARSLHAAGAEATLLFIGGNNLEERLLGQAWALPHLVKERRPGHVRANLAAIRAAAADSQVVLSHLNHDHLLCVAAGLHKRSLLVRNFRNPSHFRADPYHRHLARRVTGAVLASSSFEPRLARLCGPIPRLCLPVPVEDRFAPGADRTAWRDRFGIPHEAQVVGMVGKLAPGRGFELLLETAARIDSGPHVLAVGHGEAQPRLERLAARLGIAERLHWAGYQEQALPELYGAMDVQLFAAPGSDHGHRALSEAQGCGCPVVAAAVPGVEDLVVDGRTGRVVQATAADLARAVAELLADRAAAARLAAAGREAVTERRLAPSGECLLRFLEEVRGVVGSGSRSSA